MTESLNIGVIGLGVMGQRMLERLKSHPRLRPALVWDADLQTLARVLQQYPQLRAAASAEALLASPGLDSAYIATPPEAHLRLANLAFDAGLAVLCEKPLTMDFPLGHQTVARIAREGLRDGVNFSLASSPGLRAFKAAWAERPASVSAVDISLSFAAWPRPWQQAAGAWLRERAEGGFAREVLSHFVYVLQHVLGKAEVLSSSASYPEDGRLAETALSARLLASGVPVTIDAAVRGELADVNRLSVGSLQLHDWFGVSEQGQVVIEPGLGRQQSQEAQLEQWVALIEGRPHGLPRFAEALAVQETIEALLAGK